MIEMKSEYEPEKGGGMPEVMRSVHYVPGNNEKAISKVPDLPADIIVFDLEASIPPLEKENARNKVGEAIPEVADVGSEIYVRLNGWTDTPLTVEDLETVVQPGLDGVVLALTEEEWQVKALGKKISDLEEEKGMELGSVSVQLLIETAKAVLNAGSLATANKRVNSLVFGAVDYVRDMRVEPTHWGEEVNYARAMTAMAARASGTVAIDTPWPSYQNMEGFKEDSKYGRSLGYEGRMLIHPKQIEVSNEIYKPDEDGAERARELVEHFEKEGIEKGKAAVPFEGEMIDWPVYKQNKDLLAKVELIEEKEEQIRKS